VLPTHPNSNSDSPSINDCRTVTGHQSSILYGRNRIRGPGVRFPALSWLSSSPLGDIFQKAPNFEIEHTRAYLCGCRICTRTRTDIIQSAQVGSEITTIPIMAESDIFSVMLIYPPLKLEIGKVRTRIFWKVLQMSCFQITVGGSRDSGHLAVV
jgi:hypothetical protein